MIQRVLIQFHVAFSSLPPNMVMAASFTQKKAHSPHQIAQSVVEAHWVYSFFTITNFGEKIGNNYLKMEGCI